MRKALFVVSILSLSLFATAGTYDASTGCATHTAAGAVSAEAPLGPYNNPEDQWRILSIEGDEHVSEFAEIGINMVHDSGSLVMWSLKNDAPKPTAQKEAERMRRVRDSFQKAGVGYGPYFRYAHDAEGKKLYPRIRRDGQVVNEIDAATPAYLERLAKGIAYEASQVGGDIGGVFVASEMRGRAEPSFTSALTNAYRQATGREIPPEAVGRNPIPWQQVADFPKDGVVPDDWPVLDFYRWFWRKGDGWSAALDVTASAYEKTCGRRLLTIFDPVLRAPSQWGNLGEGVKQLGNWTYTTPEPYRILYPIAELQAQTRERPGLQTHVGVQAIMYRSQSAPLGQHPANEPAWTKEFPNARYITTAPDILEESLWHVFSRQTDGISLHHESSLVDMTPHDDKGYQCTSPEALRRIGKVFAEVGIPLGPLFRAVPERAPQVAVLESVSAQILGAHITWSPHRYFSETMFIADAANLAPYVLYEDEVKRDGIPASVKTLVLPKCDVLTRTTYEKIRAFQARGGRLVADKMLLSALKADATYITVEDEERNTHGDFDNDFQGKYLDAAVRQASVQSAAKKLKSAAAVDLYADSDKIDILVHARTYGTADYVFAVNDRRTAGDYIGPWRRVLEKGLPNAGLVTVRRPAGAVYDLVRHTTVPFSVRNGMTEIPVAFATNDGRVFLVVDQPLAPLSVALEGTKLTVTSSDRTVMIPIRIDGFGAKPWYAVVKDGVWSRDFGCAPANLTVTNLADGQAATCRSVVKAAWTEENISCPVGSLLAGYNANDVSVAKADDLFLCACGVDDGQNRVFIFAFDLLGIDAVNIAPLRAATAKTLGVPAANVLFSFTHNHHGPHTRIFNTKTSQGQANVDEKYMAFLRERVAAVAERLAADGLWREVKIGFHSSAVDENRNRRFTSPDNRASFNPHLRALYRTTDLIADKELGTVAFLDPTTSNPLYVIGNYAAHTLASHAPGLGGYRITADFPGFFRRYVKSESGADAMFVQGACGDLVPKEDELGMDGARRTGVALGKAALASVIDIQRNADRYQLTNPKVGGVLTTFTSSVRRKWVKKLGCAPTLDLELQAVAFGDVAFVSVPGETVNELGLEIKWHSPFKRTFVSYCGTGYYGYISPANFVAAGGYEGRHQRFAARDSLTLVQKAQDGLFELRERLFPDSSVDGEKYPDCVERPLVSLPGDLLKE